MYGKDIMVQVARETQLNPVNRPLRMIQSPLCTLDATCKGRCSVRLRELVLSHSNVGVRVSICLFFARVHVISVVLSFRDIGCERLLAIFQ